MKTTSKAPSGAVRASKRWKCDGRRARPSTRRDGGVRDGALDEQVLRLAVVLLVSALLPLELEREGGVLVDEDPAHRVHDVEEAERRHRRDASRGRELGPTLGVAPATAGSPPPRRWRQSRRAARADRASAATKPCARASATSSGVKPPSGPISATAASARDGSSSSRRAGSSSHGTRRRPGHGCATSAANGAGGSIAGTRVRPDCFAAATAMRRQRSTCAARPTTRCASPSGRSDARRARSPSRRPGPSSCLQQRGRQRPGRAATRARVGRWRRCGRSPRARRHDRAPPRARRPRRRARAAGRPAARRSVRRWRNSAPAMRTPGLASAHAGQVEAQHQRSSAQRAPGTGGARRGRREARERGRDGRQPGRRGAPRRPAGRRARPRRRERAGLGDQRVREQVRDHEVEPRAHAPRRRRRAGATSRAPLRVEVRARQGQHARRRCRARRRAARRAARAPRRARPSPCRRRAPIAPAPAPSASSISSRQVRVVSCWPVPNAMPGSMTSTSRPGASGTSHGGATSERVPIASGRWWRRKTASQSSAGSTAVVTRTSPAAGSISARLASQRSSAPAQRGAPGRRARGPRASPAPRSGAGRARVAHPGDDRRDALVRQEARDRVGRCSATSSRTTRHSRVALHAARASTRARRRCQPAPRADVG